jgi:flagellin-like hook-associated protein FlgL
MRVPNISTYVNSTYRLGNLTYSLENANEVASTQKQINEISDDPLGLSQVMTIKNTLGNLDQIGRNVNMGKSWIRTIENSLDGINDLILEVKTDITRLANDSTTEDERNDAIERIQSVIDQIITLGNIQVNGNYVFSGTDTNIIPLEYDAGTDKVVYKGNEIPFEIRTDKSLGVQVGRTGSTTFWDQEIHINSTNNTIVFKEDNGHGDAFEKTLHAVIPDGLYRKADLETAVRNALNDVSAQKGYGVTYTVEYDETSQTYRIQEDGSYQGYVRTEFLWETGNEAYLHDIQASGNIQPEDIRVSLLNKSALTIDTKTGETGPEPLRLTWDRAGEKWHVKDNPGYVMPASFSGTSRGVDIALNDEGVPDISIKFDTPVRDGAFIEFQIASSTDDTSTGHEIGFNKTNLTQAPPVSDIRASYITELVIGTSGNNTIDFVETNATGGVQTLTANFNTAAAAVTYTDMDALALAIETAMETASAAPTSGANTIDYTVSYDPLISRFNIREQGTRLNELTLSWNTSTGAADTLGYYPLADTLTYPHSAVTIGNANNRLDFAESQAGTGGPFTTFQAIVPSGTYDDMADLADAVETAMEAVSAFDYDVSYDQALSRFTIQQTGGAALTDFYLLWDSGAGAGASIGETLGYNPELDDTGAGLGPFTADTASMLMSRFSVEIDGSNNYLDFEEINTAGTSTILSATIPEKTYSSIHEMEAALEAAMNDASTQTGNGVVYDVSYDETNHNFDILRTTSGAALNELKLLWDTGENQERSIGDVLGYDTTGDDIGGTAYSSTSGSAPTWISFDATNNAIDFSEISATGEVSDEVSITIPPGNYRDMNQVASLVQTAMRNASPSNTAYSVVYDDTFGFMIKGSGSRIKGFDLLWETGAASGSSAASKLGIPGTTDTHVVFGESDEPVVNIVIDNTNDKLDFMEINTDGLGKDVGQLTALIDHNTYTSHLELAREVEEALELESRQSGNSIDYTVSWDDYTQKFAIKENGTQLREFRLLWETGDNTSLAMGGTGEGIGSILGFNADEDDVSRPLESGRTVEWGVFNTLIDLKQYLSDNDRDGIERSIGRLETNFDNMTSRIVDAGMKFSRLEIRETITTNVSLTLTERRSNLEDADMIKSIMDLKNIETAYQAALSSTAKVLSLSLVDYLR